MPLNVLLKPREIAYHLRDSDAKAMFCFQGTPELPMAEAAKAALPWCPRARQLIVLPHPSIPLDPAFDDGIGRHPARAVHRRPAAGLRNGGDEAGRHRRHSLYVGHDGAAERRGADAPEHGRQRRWCRPSCAPSSHDGTGRHATAITLPLFHATAQTAQMLAYLHLGGTLVLLPRFDPAALLTAMTSERVTHWIGVPTMYWTLLKYAREQGIDVSRTAATLRLAVSGGAPMPVELMNDFEKTFGVRIIEGYGLSETSPVASFNHLDRPSKPGTVGQPLFAVDIMIVDDKDEPVETGQPGEVVIRGHNVMKGYYKQPEATAEAMRNGWFHTGDIGVLDADGYLSIVDRKKDMILRGGFNVYPRELEEVMLTHPAVSLVAVVGVPDERLGEEVKAFVVKKPGADVTEDALRAWCKEQFAAYKYPRLIEFRTELPTSATGKILKRELRVQ